MLVPFQKQTMAQDCFLKHEAQYNLLYRISEGECATALQAEDGGAIALQNVGRGLWFWVDGGRGQEYEADVIAELAEALKNTGLPRVSAAPGYAARFAVAYNRLSGAKYRLGVNLMAYVCPALKMPSTVPGVIVKAEERDAPTVAELYYGFNKDIFGTENSIESMLADAASRIKNNDLFLWVVNGKTVSMAVIAHRTARHARVNSVYTLPAERKKGFASAVVGAVSQLAMNEGRIPLLYADLANPYSNKVYCNLGYVPAGAIDEYGFTYGG